MPNNLKATRHQWPTSMIKDFSESERFNFDPEYQRNAVWKSPAKKLLIDSLWRKYDLPKIYVVEDGRKFDIVDGQQRLRAITEYMNNEFTFTVEESDRLIPEGVSGTLYKDLSAELKQDFHELQIDVMKLENYAEDHIQDMFLRLQDGVALNAAEKRRAIPGNMKVVVKDIVTKEFYKEYSHENNMRFSHEDAAAKVLHIILRGNGGYIGITPTAISRTYKDFKTISSSHKAVKALSRTTAVIAASYKKEGINPKFKKWAQITLPLVVKELIELYSFNADDKKRIASIFSGLEKRRIENGELPEESQDAELSDLTDSARADSPALMKSRHDYMLRVFLNELPHLVPKDPNRGFSEAQRLALFFRTAPDYVCQDEECNKKISQTDFEADHIVAHSNGGQTTLDNGQALCRPCNQAKGAN